ncbi:MAG: hypothetical protein LH645_13050 [Actinomycetia bacterium]|nr:hypothetical protein [Actinomycetes bacterium]
MNMLEIVSAVLTAVGATLLLLAGTGKLFEVRAWRDALAQHGLPGWLYPVILVGVPAAELGIGICTLLMVTLLETSPSSLILAAQFFLGMALLVYSAQLKRTRPDADCGCSPGSRSDFGERCFWAIVIAAGPAISFSSGDHTIASESNTVVAACCAMAVTVSWLIVTLPAARILIRDG